MRGFRHHCLIVTAALALLGAPHAAWADCTNPAAPESWTRYDFTAHTLYLCDGTNWISMGSGSSSGSAGYIQFSDGSGGFTHDSTANGKLFWDSTNHRLGIGTSVPSGDLSFAADANRTINMERAIAGTTGRNLTISAGGSRAATADLNGGDLYLSSGIATGTGSSNIYLLTAAGDTTGTTNNAPTSSTGMSILGNGRVGIGTATPSFDLSFRPFSTLGGRTIGMERGSSTVTRRSLTIQAGAPTAGATDTGGGHLYLSSGIATGTGSSNIYFRTATSQGSTATTDNTPTDKMTILGNGNVGIGTTTPSAPLSFGTGNVAQKLLLYENANSRYGFGIQAGEMRTFMQSTASIGVTWGTVDFADGTTWSEKMRLTKDGNLGVGTTNPSTKLEVNGDVKAVSYLYSSDRRLKTDIAPLPAQLEKIAALEPVSYVLKSDPERHTRLGLIAQDVEAVYPEIVQGQGEAMKAVDYAALVSPLIAAVKELKAANDNLAAEVAALKQQRLTSPVARPNAPQTGTRQPATRRTLNQ